MTSPRIDKWKRWCEGTFNNNVLTMYLQRYAWREVVKILQDHGQLPDSYWWEFMRDTYATTQAIAVRRQADTHRDAASLGKLIEEIRDDASQLTREFWIGLWDEPTDTVRRRLTHLHAEQGWNDQYGGSIGTHLDPAIPAKDFDTLTAASTNVKQYVDEHVAHADAVPAEVTLTLDEVHDAVDVIGDLFKKYYNLLTASSYVQLEPVIQDNWKAVFREPWLRADASAELQTP